MLTPDILKTPKKVLEKQVKISETCFWDMIICAILEGKPSIEITEIGKNAQNSLIFSCCAKNNSSDFEKRRNTLNF